MNRTMLALVALLALPASGLAQEEAAPPPSPFARPRTLRIQAPPVQAEPEAEVEAQVEPVVEPAGDPNEVVPAQAIEPSAEGDVFEDDPAADEALEQALEDGFAGEAIDDLAEPVFAPSQAQAQEAAPAEGEAERGEAQPAADPHAGDADAEAHGPNYPAMILNFLVWLAIIVFLLRKPLSEYLKNRRVAVLEGLEESKRIKEEAEAKHAEYTERLAHLDEELAKLRQEMIQAGEAERDRIIAEAETRAARMRRDAQFVIDQQMKQLKADLTREAIEAAVKAADEVLSAQTGGADQERLAKAYLGDLGSSIGKGEVQA